MTIRSEILRALEKSGVLCDDCLSEVTRITPRQSVNMSCRELHEDKVLSRPRETCPCCNRVKIVNRLSATRIVNGLSGARPREPISLPLAKPMTVAPSILSNDRPWYWEGSVQDKIVRFLESQGHTVHSTSDTATRQQGKDIIAADAHGRTVWVTVKGFPEMSKNTQARHWFAGALLDLARYKDESEDALLAMGLPQGFSTYEGLLRRTQSVRRFLRYVVYWVRPDGTVVLEDAGEASAS